MHYNNNFNLHPYDFNNVARMPNDNIPYPGEPMFSSNILFNICNVYKSSKDFILSPESKSSKILYSKISDYLNGKDVFCMKVRSVGKKGEENNSGLGNKDMVNESSVLSSSDKKLDISTNSSMTVAKNKGTKSRNYGDLPSTPVKFNRTETKKMDLSDGLNSRIKSQSKLRYNMNKNNEKVIKFTPKSKEKKTYLQEYIAKNINYFNKSTRKTKNKQPYTAAKSSKNHKRIEQNIKTPSKINSKPRIKIKDIFDDEKRKNYVRDRNVKNVNVTQFKYKLSGKKGKLISRMFEMKDVNNCNKKSEKQNTNEDLTIPQTTMPPSIQPSSSDKETISNKNGKFTTIKNNCKNSNDLSKISLDSVDDEVILAYAEQMTKDKELEKWIGLQEKL